MKKITKILRVAALVVATTFVVSCNSSNNGGASEETLTEGEMESIAEQYVPYVVQFTYKTLADATQKLYSALASASDKGVDALTDADVENICDLFLDARQYWEMSEAFLYGAATDFSIDPHIDTWPLDLDGLATALSNSAQMANLEGEDGISYANAKLGQELLGFHGIEFIIFRDGVARTAADLQSVEDNAVFKAKNVTVTGEEELIYATAVAGDLRNCCYQLYVSWNGDAGSEYTNVLDEFEIGNTTVAGRGLSYGANMLLAGNAGSTYATWQEVMADILVAGCSNICNEVANVKMGNAHTGEDVNYIESPYSKQSFLDFYNNILSIQYSLYGQWGAAIPGERSIAMALKNYNSSLYNSLEKSLEASFDALATCMYKGAFVDIYDDACVQDAMNAINELDSVINKIAQWIVLQ